MELFEILNKSQREEEKNHSVLKQIDPFEDLPASSLTASTSTFHLGELQNEIKFIKYNSEHVVIATKANHVIVYGRNEFKQLGTGDNRIRKEFTFVEHFNDKIKFLECGNSFTIIVNNFNEFYISGILSRVYKTSYFTEMKLFFSDNIKFIRCGNNCLFIITKNNAIYGIGSNEYGKLGLTLSDETDIITKLTQIKEESNSIEIKDLQCNNHRTIYLDSLGQIFVTGANYCGQLGTNNSNNLDKFTKIDLPYKVKQISCTSGSTLILNENNELFITGHNKYGELGNISDENDCFPRFTFIKVNFKEGEINKIYNSYDFYCMFTTSNNLIYVSGINNKEALGIKEKHCKISREQARYLDTFTKMECFYTDRKFIYPILLIDKIFIVTSDYEMNSDEEENTIALKCFISLNNEQLTDITFNVF
ncbi:hypothetical protein ABK040_003932 [Willaertia magna]